MTSTVMGVGCGGATGTTGCSTTAAPMSAHRFGRRRDQSATSLFDYSFSDFELVGYDHHPALPAPVAV